MLVVPMILLIVFGAVISVCASDDFVVAGAKDLLLNASSYASGGFEHASELIFNEEEKRAYVGTYPNGELANGVDSTGVSFALSGLFEGFNTKDYPYIKVGYKAYLASAKNTDVNVGINYNGKQTRLWGKRVTVDNSGTYTSFILDLKSYTSAEHAAAGVYSFDSIDDTPINYVRLKPYYGSAAISADDYFLVEYIGAFKSEADALAYEHPEFEPDLSLNYGAYRLGVGDEFTLKTTVVGGTLDDVVYKSSDDTVVSVDENGKVTALKEGVATVSAAIGNVSAECTVVAGKPGTVTIVSTDTENYGKTVKVNALGDSITEWADPTGRTYHAWWAENYNIQNRNYGVGGTRISDTSDNSFLVRSVTMDTDADLVTVKGGVNDWIGLIPLGESGTRTRTTFEGGLRLLIESLITRFPDNQIVFFTPIKCLRTSTNTVPLSDYVDRVIAVCNEYGIPVIDIYNAEETDFTDTPELFYDGDLHPSDEAEGILGEYMMKKMVDIGIVKIGSKIDFTPIEVGEHYVIDADKLYEISSVSSGLTKSLTDGKVKIYSDGEYSNAQLSVSLADYDILLKEYPAVKIKYKTNINSAKGTMLVDLNIGTTYDKSGTRTAFTLFSYKPKFDPDSSEHIFVDSLDNDDFPNSSLGAGYGFDVADEVSEYDSLTLKLWYSYSNKSAADTYFEIESIGFYKTVDEAISDGF